MSENTIQLEKEKGRKGKDTSKSSLLGETQAICMPSNKKKLDIGKLIPFNIQGNKTELLANSIGGLVETQPANRIVLLTHLVEPGLISII